MVTKSQLNGMPFGEFGCVGQQHLLEFESLPRYIDVLEAFGGPTPF